MAAFTFKTALDQVIAAYKADGGGEVVPMYGMTPMLVKQVENMAPADIFLSADANWMDYLQDHKLIRTETRIELLTRRSRGGDPQRQCGGADGSRDRPRFPIAADYRRRPGSDVQSGGSSGRPDRPCRARTAGPVASRGRQSGDCRKPARCCCAGRAG